MKKPLDHDFWIRNLSFDGGISVHHINEFFTLRSKLQEVHLANDTMHTITWKFTTDGKYSTASAKLPSPPLPECIFLLGLRSGGVTSLATMVVGARGSLPWSPLPCRLEFWNEHNA